MADHNGPGNVEKICKENSDAEVWSRGLKSLISSDEGQRSKIDGRIEGGLCFDDARDLISTSPSESSISTVLDFPSPDNNHNNITSLPVASSSENLIQLKRSDAANMNIKGTSSDVYRVSVSSAPSTSSHGSAQDDCDALGDVYVWGEVIFETSPKSGSERDQSFSTGKTDLLLPKPLESNLVLDVNHVACGVRHAALVTKQGEVFTWGEESGGRLGHGNGMDVTHPCLLEYFTVSNAEFVSCGEFHTCVVTTSGELYSWGDGTHNVGLLGLGNTVSHWIPKRVSGPLEGLHVTYVTCGTWHTALITASGQLFTFGDGSFGALGHGNRESVSQPKEVESLMGLRTTAVACGVWHTAAVVEVIVAESNTTVSSGKLFTWGDGDKYRLGHGDKEPRVKPTCVASLIDYNFHKVACGHSITIGLTTAGHICTMGSTVYGQLGNPLSDGKIPRLVEDKLLGEFVTDVSCGSYHVAVLTARNEVFTWGKGTNGRLGHGDAQERKTPTLVEALKDRSVKQIACGANFTAAICQHKWVSGAEQSQCSTCRQAFGFTRKRHNCYHCGLVHCHSCSSRKALRAALSPNPGKPYRVCDSCFVKLNSVSENGGAKRIGLPRFSNESRDRFEKADLRLSKTSVPTNLDLIKNLDIKAARHVKKADSLSLIRPPQVNSLLQFKDITFASGVDQQRGAPKSVRTSKVQSLNPSRAVSPFSRRPSPPRSATPVPTTGGLSFSKSATEGLKKANELLNQEVKMLRAQVESLRQRCEHQESELQTSAKKAQEAISLAAEESAKAKAAKEVIKSLTAQLKDMAERLPPGFYDSDGMKPPSLANVIESLAFHGSALNGERQTRDNADDVQAKSSNAAAKSSPNGNPLQSYSPTNIHEETKSSPNSQAHKMFSSSALDNSSVEQHNNNAARLSSDSGAEVGTAENPQNGESISKSRNPNLSNNQTEAERIEQYEPGVYITLMALHDGTRDLKRVRFSRRRFAEHQAEAWWSENREKVYERYNVRGSDRSSSATPAQSARPSEELVRPTAT